jgi:hypothetical protein
VLCSKSFLSFDSLCPWGFNEKLVNEITLQPLISPFTTDYPAVYAHRRTRHCVVELAFNAVSVLMYVSVPRRCFVKESASRVLISIEAVRLSSSASYRNCRPVSRVGLIKAVSFVSYTSKMWWNLKQCVMNVTLKIPNAHSLKWKEMFRCNVYYRQTMIQRPCLHASTPPRLLSHFPVRTCVQRNRRYKQVTSVEQEARCSELPSPFVRYSLQHL